MDNRLKDILICIAGTTTQVITETIYALSKRDPPVQPCELYIITTEEGRALVVEHLLRRGILKRLIEEHNLPNIAFNEEDISVLKDRSGNPLEDIQDIHDNESVGNFITGFIREKDGDIGARLHCSIAGGRKTMGFYMGAALQLFGRPYDRLYHVLVSPEFESNSEFFYPPKKQRLIECWLPGGEVKRISTKKAAIHLAELPFIRLRDKLFLGTRGFCDLVEEGQREIDSAAVQYPLRVKPAERIVEIGNQAVSLNPMQFALYTLLLERKMVHCSHLGKAYCYSCTDCYVPITGLMGVDALRAFASAYERIFGGNTLKAEELYNKYSEKGGIPPEIIRQNISKLRKAMADQINDKNLLPFYTISVAGRHGYRRYGLRAEKGKIKIE